VNVSNVIGTYGKEFVNGGITLGVTIVDDGVAIVDPTTISTINELIWLAENQDDISGSLEIRKTVARKNRFLVLSGEGNFWGFEDAGDEFAASIRGGPDEYTYLNVFGPMPTAGGAETDRNIKLINMVPGDIHDTEMGLFNFVIIGEYTGGWKRIALVSDYVLSSDDYPELERALYPVVHPVHLINDTDMFLRYQKFSTETEDENSAKTYVKFVSPLNSPGDGSGKFSLVIRRVAADSELDTELGRNLTANDRFLVNAGPLAFVMKARDIQDLSTAVFTRRTPNETRGSSSNAP
jgi:hypothetical protein